LLHPGFLDYHLNDLGGYHVPRLPYGPALIMELMSPFKLATLPFSKLLASRS